MFIMSEPFRPDGLLSSQGNASELGYVCIEGHTTVTTGTCPEIAVSRAERGARLAGMKKMGLLLLAWLPVSPLAFPQSTPATTPVSGPNAGLSPAQVITLGSSVVPLEQGWKFEPGDSPWVNGVPVWAQAGFDDSRWAEMDLSPKAGSVDVQGRVLGWTRRGYPDLSGFAWYRLRLKVNDPGQPLWLKMHHPIGSARLTEMGNLSPYQVSQMIKIFIPHEIMRKSLFPPPRKEEA
jgi:hypothetical protein